MEEKSYKVPVIAWLKVTDFMHGWLQRELGGGARIGEQRVVSVWHLPGAREAQRMESAKDTMGPAQVDKAMSAMRRNCIVAGLAIDEDVMEREYGMTREMLRQFVPVECPSMCLTKSGVLRPWTLDTAPGRRQANELIQVIREAFWRAVEAFNREYARRRMGEKYPTIDMTEAFCHETGTPDIYAEAIKREWNRRVKNGQNRKA